MPKRYKPEDISAVFRNMVNESDRSAILIGASWLEWSLENMIENGLRKPSNAEEKNVLFSEHGLFGSFSQKINAAYFTKLIGPETKRICHIIREIRNECAHDMNDINFKIDRISNRCEQLKIYDLMLQTSLVARNVHEQEISKHGFPKLRYISAISCLTLNFQTKSLELKNVPGTIEKILEFKAMPGMKLHDINL